MTSVVAKGDRSVAIGGDATGSVIVTGDHNKVFAGSQIRLEDARINPASVYDRVELDRFVGRGWLDAQVDAMLAEQDRGVLILEAGAGLGKTAYLAHLASSRDWIHHFVETARGAGGVARGLQNLSAQLISRFEIEPYASDGVLPATAGSPESLSSLLFAAAARRDARAPQEPIVLVVDALDESAPVEGHNVMGLPKVLPRGVYLACSQRPVPVELAVEGPPPRIVRLAADEPENLTDMREFLRRAAARPAIAAALAAAGRSADEFVDTLLDRCHGVWIYLQYVIAGIELGHYAPLDLDALPRGVWQFYAEFSVRGRGGPAWRSLVLPLLGALAAVQEDASVERLCALAGMTDIDVARDLLDGGWRPFLTTVGRAPQERKYRLYHASLREFLDGRVNLDELTAAQQAVAEELAGATRAAHARIADRYLEAWGGLDSGLTQLQDPAARDLDGGYGLRHLIEHLVAGGRLLDAKRVLSAEWIREEQRPVTRTGWRGRLDRLLGRQRFVTDRVGQNAWFAAKGGTADLAAYLADQQRTWRGAEIEAQHAIADNKPAGTVALEVRCALAVASLNDVAGNVGPRLLEALVRQQVIAPSLGYAYAQQSPDADQRMQALLRVAPFLDERARTEAYRSALATMLQLSPYRAPGVPGDLPPDLPDWLLREMLQALRTVAGDRSYLIGQALARIVPVVSAPVLDEVIQIASDLDHQGVPALVAAVARSAPPAREALLKLVLDRVGRIDQYSPSTEVIAPLMSVAADLEPDVRTVVIDVAKHQLTKGSSLQALAEPLLRAVDPAGRAEIAERILAEALNRAARNAVETCGPILDQLPERARSELDALVRTTNDRGAARDLAVFEAGYLAKSGDLDAALAVVDSLGPREGTHDPGAHAQAIAGIAAFVPASRMPAVLERARGIPEPQARRNALDALAARLGSGELKSAFDATTRIDDRYSAELAQVEAIRALAPLVRSASMTDWALDSNWLPGKRLAAVASSLPAEALSQAVSRAQAIRSNEDRAVALTALAAAGAPDPAGLVREALDAAGGAHQDDRVNLLASLLGDRRLTASLQGRDRDQAFQQLMSDLVALKAQPGRAYRISEVFEQIASSFDEQAIRAALGMTGAIPDQWSAAEAFKHLAPYLPERALRVLGARQYSFGYPRSPLTQARPNRHSLARWLPADIANTSTPADPAELHRLDQLVAQAIHRERPDEQAALLVHMVRRKPNDRWLAERASSAIFRVEDLQTRLTLLLAFTEADREHRVGWNALATALALPDAPARADALEALADYVDPFARAALLRASAELRGAAPAHGGPASEPLTEVAALLREIRRPRLAETDDGLLTGGVPELFEVVKACIDGSGNSLDALAELAHRLPPDQAEAAVAHYVALLGDHRETQLTDLARALPAILPAPSAAIVATVSQALLASATQDRLDGAAIAALADQMPLDALATACRRASGSIDPRDRARVLGVLARRLADAPRAEAHRHWSELLRFAASGHRHMLLADLAALAPLTAKLGGAPALEATLDAIDHAEGWWP